MVSLAHTSSLHLDNLRCSNHGDVSVYDCVLPRNCVPNYNRNALRLSAYKFEPFRAQVIALEKICLFVTGINIYAIHHTDRKKNIIQVRALHVQRTVYIYMDCDAEKQARARRTPIGAHFRRYYRPITPDARQRAPVAVTSMKIRPKFRASLQCLV